MESRFTKLKNKIDNWIKTGTAGGPASQLQASDTTKGSSVTQSSQLPNNIITFIKEKSSSRK